MNSFSPDRVTARDNLRREISEKQRKLALLLEVELKNTALSFEDWSAFFTEHYNIIFSLTGDPPCNYTDDELYDAYMDFKKGKTAWWATVDVMKE